MDWKPATLPALPRTSKIIFEAEDPRHPKQPPPPYAEVPDLFAALEVRAADACMEVVSLLQKTKMAWTRTESSRKFKQSDIRRCFDA